jgi:hypothetical protein
VDPASIISTITKDKPPGFWGTQLPPLWTPGSSSVSSIGQGLKSLIDSIVPIEDLLGFYSAFIRILGELAAFIRNAALRNLKYSHSPSTRSWGIAQFIGQFWIMIRPTSILSQALHLLTTVLSFYRHNISCDQDESPSYSLRNVITAFNLAVCSFPESALSGSSEFKNQILNYWFFSALQSIAVDRTLAVIFGYFITTLGLMIHAKKTAQKSSYMVLILLKVSQTDNPRRPSTK